MAGPSGFPCNSTISPNPRGVQSGLGSISCGGKMNLRNAVALITGGSSGIGRAVAQSLAASGARVAITGRDKRRLADAASSLGAHAIQADVTDEADVER